MSYPYSDSTANLEKVLFPVGVDIFNQDFEQVETFREREDLIRFNSIVKTPGVVAKKGAEETYLFPTVITGNQISISAGTGFTNNGARIELLSALTITNITTLPNYTAPTNLNTVLLVLRKNAEDYSARSHPLTGVSKYTRRRIKSDTTIVEWLVLDANSDEFEVTDRDVIVLGRLSDISPNVFDTTEATGGRKILRVGEVPFAEITGFTMEGDIYMQNIYNMFDVPQWGQSKWATSGVLHNKDFIRLFAKNNCTLGLLKDIKFTTENNNYGLSFANNADVKMTLVPNLRPPVQINVKLSDEFVNIPENYVFYLNLTDSQVLLSNNTQPPTFTVTGRGAHIQVANFQTVQNFGTDSGANILKFPIAYHYFQNNVRKLIFANGQVLNLEEEIDNDGKYSGYVRRDGESVMTGSLQVQPPFAERGIKLMKSEGNPTDAVAHGIEWKNSDDTVLLGELIRVYATNPADVGVNATDPIINDMLLNLWDVQGINGKTFIFRQDGRLVIPSAPVEDFDGVRKKELIDTVTAIQALLDKKYDKTGGTISGTVVITGSNLHPAETALTVQHDTVIGGDLDVTGSIKTGEFITMEEQVDVPDFSAGNAQFYIHKDYALAHLKAYLNGRDAGLNDCNVALINNCGSSYKTQTEEDLNSIDSTSLPYTFLTIEVPEEHQKERSTLQISGMINCIYGGLANKYVVMGLRAPTGKIVQKIYLDNQATAGVITDHSLSFSCLMDTVKDGTISGIYKLDFLAKEWDDSDDSSMTFDIRGGTVDGNPSSRGNETQINYVILK